MDKEREVALVEYLKKADEAYYNTSSPIISDETYDAMVDMLRTINPKHDYLNKVGVKVQSNKVERSIPMGTLEKYHTEEEVSKWLSERAPKILLCPKYDGFAIELVYIDGVLVSASTRGDGYIGENILEAAKLIVDIPSTIPNPVCHHIIVRGEAIIPRVYHEDIKELGYTAMRNAVPGIVRSCRMEALKYVRFVAYEFIEDIGTSRVHQRERYKDIFQVEDYHIVDYLDIPKMKELREEIRSDHYEYETDGVVLKSIDIMPDNLLNPTHMIAWKYKSNKKETTLRDIEYQLGVTGYFTPIGIFDEVEFQGAKLTRASLGNMTRLANDFSGLSIGSIIEVSRRGDIIPYIESLILINEKAPPLEKLTVCPHCGSQLVYEDKEPRCINERCPEILRLQITSYVRAVGIKGIGDALVRSLIDNNYITSIPSIYTLNPEDILKLPRQGQSAVDKWKLLQEKRLNPCELLSSYPFQNLGKKFWEVLLTIFDYKDILEITEEKLREAKIKGIGDNKIYEAVTQIAEYHSDLEILGEIHNLI